MTDIRTITFRGNLYLRAEDVAEYIRTFAATEETDTRHRLEQAAKIIQALQPKEKKWKRNNSTLKT